jgi:mannose-6-phosphate isomerase-like protein (cupin superfamily)
MANPTKTMTPDEQEAYHRAAEAKIETYKYRKPQDMKGRPKNVTFLAKTDLLTVAVQTVTDGGENNLHYHSNGDQCYFVLKGRVRFHGPNDVVLGEFGESEGIVIPAGCRYWFEKVGDEDLQVLQSFGKNKSMPDMARINLEPHKAWMKEEHLTQYSER